MLFTPLVWSVLLFGIFMPLAVMAISSIIKEKKTRTKILILLFSAMGIVINPILTWISSVIYDGIDKKKLKK